MNVHRCLCVPAASPGTCIHAATSLPGPPALHAELQAADGAEAPPVRQLGRLRAAPHHQQAETSPTARSEAWRL